MTFTDRTDAGRKLAARLTAFRGRDLLVLAIPRGGVVVGYEVARALHAPLDLWVAHKIGAPGNPEFAIGSVTASGEALLDASLVERLGVDRNYLKRTIEAERQEIARRLKEYRGERPPPVLENKAVLLIDDGLATGSTARAALRSLRRGGPDTLILAVPVAPPETIEALRDEADEVISLHVPEDFRAVGQFYETFGQTSDAEVISLLRQAERNLRRQDA